MAQGRRTYAGGFTDAALAAPLASGVGTGGTFAYTGTLPPCTNGPELIEIGPGASDDEKVLISAAGGGTATIASRGADGTVAVNHQPGEIVRHVHGASDADEANAHVNDITADNHTQYLNINRHDTPTRHGPTTVIHANAGGLSADDHPQYARVDGTRHFTGAVAIDSGGLAVAGGLVVTGGETASGIITGTAHAASGLTGATALSRYVGATASGPPLSGSFVVGDFVIDQTGQIWVCVTLGSPGTWRLASPTAKARAKSTASQSIPHNTSTTVSYNLTDYDPGTALNLGAGTFTCPVAGYYQVTGSVTFTLAGAGVGQISLYKNGTVIQIRGQQIALASVANITSTVADIVKCAAGDTLSLQAFQTSGSPLTISLGGTGELTNFAVHLLSM